MSVIQTVSRHNPRVGMMAQDVAGDAPREPRLDPGTTDRSLQNGGMEVMAAAFGILRASAYGSLTRPSPARRSFWWRV